MTDLAEHSQERRNIAVIGAGIVGVSCALYLQQAGFNVTLFDRDEPGSGATYGNACTFALYGSIPVNRPDLIWRFPSLMFGQERPLSIAWRYMPKMTPWLIQFLKHCRRKHVDRTINGLGSLLRDAEDASMILFRASGGDDLISRDGTIYIYPTSESFDADAINRQRRLTQGAQIQELTATDLQDLEPNLAPIFPHAVLYPNGFTILDPKQMTSRMVDHLCHTGGHFIKGEVSAVEAQSADSVAFKVNGNRHHYDQAVLAGGAWSMQIAKDGCEKLPLDTERGYHVLFSESAELLNRPVGFADAGFYMTPMYQGLRAAGTVELGGLNAAPNPERLSYIERRVRQALPDVGPVSDTWLGFRPTLPDSLPVIGRSRHNPNLIFAFGHHHLGLTLGGITGKLVSEIAAGAIPSLDVTPFRPDRFS